MRVLLGLVLVGILGCGPTAAERSTQLRAEAKDAIEKGFYANNDLKDHDTAILHFTEAIKIADQLLESDAPAWSYPIRADAHTGLGLVYKTKGDYDKALTEYNEAIEISNVTKRYGDLGNAHLGRAGVYQLKAAKASTAEERARLETLADQEYISSRASFLTEQEYRRRQSLRN